MFEDGFKVWCQGKTTQGIFRILKVVKILVNLHAYIFGKGRDSTSLKQTGTKQIKR